MIKTALVLFLGIIMIGSTFSMFSSEALLPEDLPDVAKAPFKVKVIKTDKFVAFARPLITTVDDPANHVTPNGGVYNGVGMLILKRSDFSGLIGCSGSLLPTGQHVLTAAHCVADGSGKLVLTSGDVYFDADPTPVVVSYATVHPSYDGDYLKGNDIAILKLESPAKAEITRYDYDKNGNSVDDVIEKVGYGVSGFFSSGDDSDKYPFGTKRNDQNKYDAFADVMYQALGMKAVTDYVPGAVYQYDSDDGSKKHDAFGFFFGISDRGLGNNEVLSAPGDSGGPTLIDTNNDGTPDTVAGVTSYGITLQYITRETSDCTKEKGRVKLDSSCGEFAGDTRVSSYSSFIDDVLGVSTEPNNPPTAVANGPYSGTEDSPITFDGTDSSDLDDDPLTYSWDFGDGTTEVTTSVQISHTYTYGGDFIVTLTVSDGKGGSDMATTSAAVTEVNDAPTADPNGPYSGTVNVAITFDGSGSSDPDNLDGTASNDQTLTYSWDFGDDGSSSDVNPSHTYTTTGTFTVTLVVNDGVVDSTAVMTSATVNETSESLSTDISPSLKKKGPWNDISFTVKVTDGTNAVPNVSVQMEVIRLSVNGDGGNTFNFSGTTDDSGEITFTIMKAFSKVCYTATITDWLTAFGAGEEWDDAFIDENRNLITCPK